VSATWPPTHRSIFSFTRIDEQAGATRTSEEFRDHCRALKSLLGRRLAQNRDVYLGGSLAIRGPIASYFEIANEELPIVGDRDPNRSLAADEPELGTINLFLDDFRAGLPDLDLWNRLKSLHLGRVNLGVATGDDGLRAKLGLGGSAEQVADCVRVLRQGAIDLGLMIHLGGGESHVERTVSMVESLGLSRRDFVYLIDGREWGLGADGSAVASDLESFKHRLMPLRKQTGVKVVPYSVEKQWN
jgi:hypothetical protein